MSLRPRRVSCPLLAFAAILVLASAARAQTVSASRCAAAKTRCVAGKTHVCGVAGVRGLFSCYERAFSRSKPLDPECVTLTVTEIRECFRQAEKRSDCLTTGDADPMQGRITALVEAVVQDLHPAYPALVTDRCLVRQLKTVGEAVAAKLGCFDDAFKQTPVPACLALPQNTLAYAWTKLGDTRDCAMLPDSVAIEGLADDFVADVIVALDPQ
jgi:hypothetical protein